jgi:iron complex transport system substrate-binding protein
LTQILFDLDLGGHVVGVTAHCQLPEGVERPVVGDIQPSAEKVLATRPDVLLIQQNPDAFAAVRELMPDLRVEHFEIETLSDVSSAIRRVGEIAGRTELGRTRSERFLARLAEIRRAVEGRDRPRVLVLVGMSTGGSGTFLDEMIATAGGVNASSEPVGDWRGVGGWKTLSPEKVLASQPDVLVVQAPADRRDEVLSTWREVGLPAARAGRVVVYPDRGLTIPSSRSADHAARLAEILHPGAAGGAVGGGSS